MNRLFDKPFALSIGPQRCGTRWLDAYLRSRGDVCLPENVKEIFFFDRHFQRGPEFYASHFHPQDQHAIVTELTTTAFDSPEAPRYAQNLLGQDISLLCPLRDPVERAKDVYIDHINYGIVSGSIAEAVEQAPQILLASRYADHLERWIERFGRERLSVVYYEQLEADQPAYAHSVCQALWLPFRGMGTAIALPGRASLAKNRSFANIFKGFKNVARREQPAGAVMPEPDLVWLQERLGPEKEKLEKLLGLKIPHWKCGF